MFTTTMEEINNTVQTLENWVVNAEQELKLIEKNRNHHAEQFKICEQAIKVYRKKIKEHQELIKKLKR
jgi:CHASE3 domain sensor protein